MIKASYLVENGIIQSIEISGHAEYDHSGKDIVCAAVSTAIIVTANAIELLDLNSNRELWIDEGYFKIEVLNNNEIVNKLLLNLEYTLYDLEKQYPKYIKNQKEG
ncbi:ribosomal-processing cysteine protease Prp [Haploplasma axanthum]|uniref:Ribosomal processing cysteine protease Prp n=1 Tax=Haploplasma axanthum TaxID=29552 RepID=A0A449BEL6_HAPAX|nr:ribosomal-processing cysteine protease Prp [Haploplasma axanthum]VEU80750.1 Predicted ribosomal protein [Haploplasma axanthum]